MVDMHFEELWEKCERFHQETEDKSSISELMEQLLMKINLYKAMDAKVEIPEEERQKAKSRLMGEILLSLTQVSLKDNVDVFQALGMSLQYRNVGYFNQKYQTM